MALVVTGFSLAMPCAKADTMLAAADQSFILAAAQGSMTEVKLGEIAATNAMRADVKDFGQMMVKDHTAINNDLKALAAQKGVTLPDQLDAKHQHMVDKMSALTGAKFDHAYIKAMIKDHKMDAKEFKAEAAVTHDADIKIFLEKSIPIVEAHLQHVTALKK